MQSVFRPIESIGMPPVKSEQPKFLNNLITQVGSIFHRIFPTKNTQLIQNGTLVIPDLYTDIYKNPDSTFPKPRPEIKEGLQNQSIIYPLYLDICKEFFGEDKGLLNPALPIKATKRTNNTYQLSTPKDLFQESLKTNNPDFDSTISLILNSDFQTFTTALIILELSNPGFSTTQSDPGGVNPEIVIQTNGSNEVSTKIITDQSPETIKIYMQKLRRAIAVRLTDRSIYEGLITSSPTSANKTLIMGPQGIGKSTLTRQLSESLHIDSLELNSPQKVQSTLLSQTPLPSTNQLIEAPAFLTDKPHKKNEYSKLRFLVDKIGRGMGLRDGENLRASKEKFVKRHEGYSSLIISLLSNKNLNSLIFPAYPDIFSTLPSEQTSLHPNTKFNSLHNYINSLPHDIMNTLMLAMVFGIPNIMLISPYEPPNLHGDKKALYNTLYARQTAPLINASRRVDFSDIPIPENSSYVNLIKHIESQFPIPSKAKSLLLNVVRQIAIFQSIESQTLEV